VSDQEQQSRIFYFMPYPDNNSKKGEEKKGKKVSVVESEEDADKKGRGSCMNGITFCFKVRCRLQIMKRQKCTHF